MTTQAPRRRAEDWKESSPTRLAKSFFTETVESLGYIAANVMSLRINHDEAVVTWKDQRMGGMPRSTRHPIG